MLAIKKSSRQPFLWLSACALLSLFLLVYPVYVIRPFRYQGASELRLALAILRFRPILIAALIVVSVTTVALCWRQIQGKWWKAAAATCAALVILAAVFSRVNIYERMFHPLDTPTFTRASGVKLDGREAVIAIRVNGEARAYPIRSISYHHIVNDRVGGTPIVATY